MNNRPRYNFPQWNYGYTLGPPCPMGSGDYSMMFPAPYGGGYGPQPGFTPLGRGAAAMGMRYFRGPNRGRGGRGGRGAGSRGGSNQAKAAKKETADTDATKAEAEAAEDGEVTEEQQQEQETTDGNNVQAEETQEGGGDERPLEEILRGRNPIMFCNDNSKYRGLRMEWEQISETGPPHDKTFTWSLKMGDELMAYGSANSKKLAKNRAAEEMAKKLAKLPRVQKRSYQQMSHGSYNNMPPPPPWMMRGGRGGRGMMMRGRGRGGRMMRGRGPKRGEGQDEQQQQQEVAPTEGEPAAKMQSQPSAASTNQAQNNPISKLYEFTKRRKLPEPIFEIVSENVLDTKRTSQGFTLKRTEFTMRCSMQGRDFFGTGMTKKQAKYDSASSAWAEFGAGVGQKSIDSFLQEHKNA